MTNDMPEWEPQVEPDSFDSPAGPLALDHFIDRADRAEAAIARVESLCYGYPTGVPPVLIRAALRGDAT